MNVIARFKRDAFADAASLAGQESAFPLKRVGAIDLPYRLTPMLSISEDRWQKTEDSKYLRARSAR